MGLADLFAAPEAMSDANRKLAVYLRKMAWENQDFVDLNEEYLGVPLQHLTRVS